MTSTRDESAWESEQMFGLLLQVSTQLASGFLASRVCSYEKAINDAVEAAEKLIDRCKKKAGVDD